MNETIQDTLTERGSRYGKFLTHAEITQDLKQVVWSHCVPEKLEAIHMEAIDMILHKIGRIVNGDPNYADSWHDIAGYATLVEEHLKGNDV